MKLDLVSELSLLGDIGVYYLGRIHLGVIR